MTAPSSSPDSPSAERQARQPWWRVPTLWLLLVLFGTVLVASVATVLIAQRHADDELDAPRRVMHIGPPAAPGARPAPRASAAR